MLADDLGYNEIGSYGQKIIQTPELDKIANNSMRFTNFYAGNAACAPSRAVLLTGKKAKDNIYYRHTGYPGGIKETNPEKMRLKNKSTEIIKLAIKRMIPKGPLGRQQLSNCKIYSGEEHSHTAQQPQKIDFEKLNNKNVKR